ncbi:MAG: SRPBCC family protein [Aeromicrobium erythreum]
MAAPLRVHVTHVFASDPATVHAALSEHENLGAVFAPAKITRVRDGDTSRNGVGSVRRLKIGPLPAFEETVTRSEEPSLIEYEITKGGPLKGHWAVQNLTPTAQGGTRLEYRIGFDAPVPGLAKVVGLALTRSISAGLPKLAD